MFNCISFISTNQRQEEKQKTESNNSTLYLLNEPLQFNVFEYMPKLFVISTNNGSCRFNVDMLNDTSSVISALSQNNPQILQYHIDIDDEQNVLSKFEQMYQGKTVHFNSSDLNVANQIVDDLEINCITLDDSDFKISKEGLIDFFENTPLRTFTIQTNKKEYKCNIFGVLFSAVIREFLTQNPTKKEFKFDFEDEFDEFQLICDIFNFQKVTMTVNNMNSLKDISDQLRIENISDKIDRFILKYEKLYEKIDKQESLIDSIDSLLDLLCHIKEQTIDSVADSIVQSFWSKTESNVQELAAYIIQVLNTDFNLHPYLVDLLIQLDQKSNENDKLKILIPFIVKRMKFTIDLTIFKCSFIYNLFKKGIITKEEILKNLNDFFRKLNPRNLYDEFIEYDRNSKYDYVDSKAITDTVHSIYIWFLPEIIAIRRFDKNHIKSKKVLKFIDSFLPDKLEEYNKMRDNGEPIDSITKALRDDDVDTLQQIISSSDLNSEKKLIVPFNIFELHVPNGETNYLNYSAAYGSIKCFKYLLLNHKKCDRSTFSFAVLGGNTEIIKIVDNIKSDDLDEEDDDRFYAYNNNNAIYPFNYAFYNTRDRISNFYKIAPSIIKHQNDIFDWILQQKFTSNELDANLKRKILILSSITGNVHSFIEIFNTGFTYENDIYNSIFGYICSLGYYRFSKLFYRILTKFDNFHCKFTSESVYFGNLSIFKFCLNAEKTEKDLQQAFLSAVSFLHKNIIEYFIEKLVNEGLDIDSSIAGKALQLSAKQSSGNIFTYLLNNFEKLLKSKIEFSSEIIKTICIYNNLDAAKLAFETYFSSNKYDVMTYFILSVKSRSFEICQYMIEKKYSIDFNRLSKSFDELSSSVNEKTFSLMINNCNQIVKLQFLYFYFEPSIKNRNYEIVEFLLKQNISSDSALFTAIENKDLKMVNLILKYKNDAKFINKIYHRNTALGFAVDKEDIRIVKALLSYPSIDPSISVGDETPLMKSEQNIDIINAILDFYGDDIVQHTDQLRFLLAKIFLLISIGSEKYIKILERVLQIKNIYLGNILNNFLIYSCKKNDLDIFNLLIKYDKINLNVFDESSTPLTCALRNGNLEIAKMLIEDERTNINLNEIVNISPLSIAIDNDQSDIVDLILNHEKFDPIESRLDNIFVSASFKYQVKILSSKFYDVNHLLMIEEYFYSRNCPYNDFQTIFQYTLENGKKELFNYVINHPNFDKNKNGVESMIFKAIENNKFRTFKLFLDMLTNEVNDYKYQDKTLFQYSVDQMNVDMMKEIINHPFFDSKNIKMNDCFFNCFKDINSESFELMQFLYVYDQQHDKLIDLNRLTDSGDTVFTLIKNRHFYNDEIVDFLLSNGADPNTPNKEGKTPLHHAIEIRSIEFVRKLLETNKINVTTRIKSMNNATFLHLAALTNKESILIELLKLNKIDINATDDNGETPLIYACRFGRSNNLKPLFLNKNLDYLHCNNQNKNALQIAIGLDDEYSKLGDEVLKDKFIFYQTLFDKIGNYNVDDLNNLNNYLPFTSDAEQIKCNIKMKQQSMDNDDDEQQSESSKNDEQTSIKQNIKGKNIVDFVDNSSCVFSSDIQNEEDSKKNQSNDLTKKDENENNTKETPVNQNSESNHDKLINDNLQESKANDHLSESKDNDNLQESKANDHLSESKNNDNLQESKANDHLSESKVNDNLQELKVNDHLSESKDNDNLQESKTNDHLSESKDNDHLSESKDNNNLQESRANDHLSESKDNDNLQESKVNDKTNSEGLPKLQNNNQNTDSNKIHKQSDNHLPESLPQIKTNRQNRQQVNDQISGTQKDEEKDINENQQHSDSKTLPQLHSNEILSDKEKNIKNSEENLKEDSNDQIISNSQKGITNEKSDSNNVIQIKEPNLNSNQEQISNKNLELNSSPRNVRNQIKSLQKKSEQGDSESQYLLGIRYSTGKGVPIDKEKAFNLYLSAAEQGHMNAQYSAAACYSYGKGTKIDKKKAFDLYLKSAEQGFDKAQFAVAHFFQYGIGDIEKSHEKATEWYQKAADQGHKGSLEALELE